MIDPVLQSCHHGLFQAGNLLCCSAGCRPCSAYLVLHSLQSQRLVFRRCFVGAWSVQTWAACTVAVVLPIHIIRIPCCTVRQVLPILLPQALLNFCKPCQQLLFPPKVRLLVPLQLKF